MPQKVEQLREQWAIEGNRREKKRFGRKIAEASKT